MGWTVLALQWSTLVARAGGVGESCGCRWRLASRPPCGLLVYSRRVGITVLCRSLLSSADASYPFDILCLLLLETRWWWPMKMLTGSTSLLSSMSCLVISLVCNFCLCGCIFFVFIFSLIYGLLSVIFFSGSRVRLWIICLNSTYSSCLVLLTLLHKFLHSLVCILSEVLYAVEQMFTNKYVFKNSFKKIFKNIALHCAALSPVLHNNCTG